MRSVAVMLGIFGTTATAQRQYLLLIGRISQDMRTRRRPRFHDYIGFLFVFHTIWLYGGLVLLARLIVPSGEEEGNCRSFTISPGSHTLKTSDNT